MLTGVYALDAFLAACPLHWCCMRSIPPKNVVQHHVPFVLGMMPSCWLALHHSDGFRDGFQEAPSAIVYMAAGSLTSGNEALWVASSFFPLKWLDSKAYRVGQKVFALNALSQFLVLGGYGAIRTLVDFVPLIYANGQGTFVRACMASPCAVFVIVVPFVQIPLLRGAFARLKDAINGQDRPPGRSASSDELHPPPVYSGAKYPAGPNGKTALEKAS